MSENRSIFPASRSVETGNRDVGRDSFDPQVERSVPSAPIDGSIFTNSFLRKVKSTGAGRGESVKSPGSSKVSDSPSPAPKEGNTAMAMLSPVLSRVREKHRQAEMQLLAEESNASPDSDRIPASNTNSVIPGFKATAQAINAFRHPPSHMPSHKGGEGVRRLVETREHDSKFLGFNTEYWDLSLFSINGRAWPVLPQILYVVYCTVIIAIVMTCVPNYKDVREFAGLQYLISTLGLALFLLLSFRTNSSYERWWEGRKLWEGISLKIQDTARIAQGWVAPHSQTVASGLIRWSLAFAFVAKKQLRVELTYPELAGILSQKDIDELEEDADPISVASSKITDLVHQCAHGPAQTPPPIYSTLDNNIKGLNADLGSCQRILNTPMPFAYIVHLRSFMVLWLLGLPFAFVTTLGWWSIIVCCVVGYELLGFETIGVEIENPFGRDYNDLPIDMITTELFVKMANVLGKLGQEVDVEPILCLDPLRHELHHHRLHTMGHRSHSNSPKAHPNPFEHQAERERHFAPDSADDAV